MNAKLHALGRPVPVRWFAAIGAALAWVACGAAAEAQVVYYNAWRPVVAAPVVAAPIVSAPVVAAPMMTAPVMTGSTYVSNYRPTGNYATVTAYSPPVVGAASSVAVTSYYAPSVAAAPLVAPAPTVAYYAPPAVAAPVVAAPVTTFYAPAVPAQLYRRGPLGVYRPVRSAYMLTY